jgi:hypothetical protein
MANNVVNVSSASETVAAMDAIALALCKAADIAQARM